MLHVHTGATRQALRQVSTSISRSALRVVCLPKGVKKSNLPEKDCAVCGRPFTWRKKWEKNWPEIRYCSERCRRDRGKAHDQEPGEPRK